MIDMLIHPPLAFLPFDHCEEFLHLHGLTSASGEESLARPKLGAIGIYHTKPSI